MKMDSEEVDSTDLFDEDKLPLKNGDLIESHEKQNAENVKHDSCHFTIRELPEAFTYRKWYFCV